MARIYFAALEEGHGEKSQVDYFSYAWNNVERIQIPTATAGIVIAHAWRRREVVCKIRQASKTTM